MTEHETWELTTAHFKPMLDPSASNCSAIWMASSLQFTKTTPPNSPSHWHVRLSAHDHHKGTLLPSSHLATSISLLLHRASTTAALQLWVKDTATNCPSQRLIAGHELRGHGEWSSIKATGPTMQRPRNPCKKVEMCSHVIGYLDAHALLSIGLV